MSDLAHLKIWDDPAIRNSLSWYLEVAENRRPAKFRIASTLATQIDPVASSEQALWAELDRLTPILNILPQPSVGLELSIKATGSRCLSHQRQRPRSSVEPELLPPLVLKRHNLDLIALRFGLPDALSSTSLRSKVYFNNSYLRTIGRRCVGFYCAGHSR